MEIGGYLKVRAYFSKAEFRIFSGRISPDDLRRQPAIRCPTPPGLVPRPRAWKIACITRGHHVVVHTARSLPFAIDTPAQCPTAGALSAGVAYPRRPSKGGVGVLPGLLPSPADPRGDRGHRFLMSPVETGTTVLGTNQSSQNATVSWRFVKAFNGEQVGRRIADHRQPIRHEVVTCLRYEPSPMCPEWTPEWWSGRRDSNPRPQPWQGCALPLSYTRVAQLLGRVRRARTLYDVWFVELQHGRGCAGTGHISLLY